MCSARAPRRSARRAQPTAGPDRRCRDFRRADPSASPSASRCGRAAAHRPLVVRNDRAIPERRRPPQVEHRVVGRSMVGAAQDRACESFPQCLAIPVPTRSAPGPRRRSPTALPKCLGREGLPRIPPGAPGVRAVPAAAGRHQFSRSSPLGALLIRLMFEDDAQRRRDRLVVDGVHSQRQNGATPVDRLRDRRQLFELHPRSTR